MSYQSQEENDDDIVTFDQSKDIQQLRITNSKQAKDFSSLKYTESKENEKDNSKSAQQGPEENLSPGKIDNKISLLNIDDLKRKLLLYAKQGDKDKFVSAFDLLKDYAAGNNRSSPKADKKKNNLSKFPKIQDMINFQDSLGNTCLHVAAEEGNTKIVDLLLKSKIDLNIANKNNSTALHLSVKNGFFDISKMLVEKGASISETDIEKNNCIHLCSQIGHTELLKYLLDKCNQKIDILQKNSNKKSCIDLAKSDKIVNILKEYYANIKYTSISKIPIYQADNNSTKASKNKSKNIPISNINIYNQIYSMKSPKKPVFNFNKVAESLNVVLSNNDKIVKEITQKPISQIKVTENHNRFKSTDHQNLIRERKHSNTGGYVISEVNEHDVKTKTTDVKKITSMSNHTKHSNITNPNPPLNTKLKNIINIDTNADQSIKTQATSENNLTSSEHNTKEGFYYDNISTKKFKIGASTTSAKSNKVITSSNLKFTALNSPNPPQQKLQNLEEFPEVLEKHNNKNLDTVKEANINEEFKEKPTNHNNSCKNLNETTKSRKKSKKKIVKKKIHFDAKKNPNDVNQETKVETCTVENAKENTHANIASSDLDIKIDNKIRSKSSDKRLPNITQDSDLIKYSTNNEKCLDILKEENTEENSNVKIPPEQINLETKNDSKLETSLDLPNDQANFNASKKSNDDKIIPEANIANPIKEIANQEEDDKSEYLKTESDKKYSKKFAITEEEANPHNKDSNEDSGLLVKSISLEEEIITPSSFICHALLGKGSFGEVYLVEKLSNKNLYAMKVLLKSTLMSQNLMKYALTERNVLSVTNHPFIVKLNYAFQTADRLFLILDYCPGGDLSEHLSRLGKFKEEHAKFYLCEMILAIEDLHRRDIIFRDLKPDNIVLDYEGHAMLTDFGLSKEGIEDNQITQSFCGSVAYLAPEMLKRRGHGKSVDWYLLGVVFYELLVGMPPFFDKNKYDIIKFRDQLFRNIQKASLKFPKDISADAADLLQGVI